MRCLLWSHLMANKEELSKLDGWQMNKVCTFVMFTQAPAYVVQSPLV